MPLPQEFPFIGLFGAHSSAQKINNYTTQYVCVYARVRVQVCTSQEENVFGSLLLQLQEY